MKHLILLFIALTIQLSGQEESVTFTDSRWVFNVSDNLFIIDDSRDFDGHFDDYISLMFLESLEQYEQECYADSSRTNPYLTIDDGGSGIIRYSWYHPEPTLKGFIEFLKRKEGR